MSGTFYVYNVVAVNAPGPYTPLIYQVHQNDSVTGFGIPMGEQQHIGPMRIHQDATPTLRVAKADGTFTISSDFNGGEYYIFAFWDQEPTKNAPALWQGTNADQNFTLTLDLSKPGLHAFGLAPL
jgi:hypothetical protein